MIVRSDRRSQVFRRLKLLVVLLVSFGALFFPCAAFATQVTFSTAKNTPILYVFTSADTSSYDPSYFGIYDDTFCDVGTIATQHGGTANMEGGPPDTIYYTPPSGYVGNDTVTFYNTTDGFNCIAQQAIATVMAPAPAVSSLSPISGTTAGSTSVVIAGSNFSGGTAVTFGGTNALNYVVNSSTQITATSPAHSAGTVDVKVTTGSGTSAAVTADHYSYIPALAISTTTLPTPLLYHAYNQRVATTGGTTPITFSISSGSLPTGLSLDSVSGVISGTPTASGAYSFTVRATDSGTPPASQAYSGTIATLVTITPGTLPAPILNVAYNTTIPAGGGSGPITFGMYNGSTLPVGLSLNSATGVISGTPTLSGTFSFSIYATDGNSLGVEGYSVTIVASLAITTATLPTPVLGVAYSGTVATTGGTAPIAFSISSGLLPTGLSLNSATGAISGTPTVSGAYNFTVRGTDSNAISASQAYSGTIATSLAITTATLPTPVLGVTYSGTVVTSGGTAPIAFSVTAGALPTGLSLNSASGVISGTPTAAGAYNFTLHAVDANTVTANQVYSGTIAANLAIATLTLPTPLLNVAYSQTVATTGGTAPIVFAIATGTLPTGLTLNAATGAITGTPTAAGAYAFTIRATDANAIAANQSYSGTIAASLAISSTTLPTPVIGAAYNQAVATTGGTAPLTFSIAPGTLPSGLSLSVSGTITGTPTTPGSYSFTVTVTDAHGIMVSRTYSGTIAASLAIASATLPAPAIGVAYSQTVTTTGGTAPITFASTAGTLPTGLTLNTATGAISGTPTAAGSYNFTIRATDANTITASQAYSGTIGASLAIGSATLPTPVIGVAYSQTVTTTGGTAPITFASTAGALPAGLTLNLATGAISGTPTTAGAYTFAIRATDANAIVASQSYSGTIGAGLAIGSATLPTPVIGVAYSQSVTTTGGTAPITFALTAGTLPTGLTLNTAMGAITGTPTADGAYSFTIRATDANAIAASQAYSGTIGAGLTIGSATLPTPVIGVAYTQVVTTTGGTAPITFSVTNGALPIGLTLNPVTGAIAGTPTTAGAYTFTIRAIDANSIAASHTYAGTIGPGLAIGSATLPTPVIGVAYSQIVTTTGGAAPIAFAVAAGTLPTGLSLNTATGAIAGTPTGAGAYTYTIRATDATAITASQTYSGTIAATLAIAPATLPTPVISVAYNQTITTTGGTLPITFSLTAGTLPAGLSLNTATGAVSGASTTAGAYAFTIRAVDAAAQAATQSYSGTIGALPSLARLAPNSGPTAGGTSVTISGTAFTGATAVVFGSTRATTFTVVSATSIVATSPAGSGIGAVSVVTPGGTTPATAGATFTWVAAPAVTSISPDSGPFAGGTVVTITGRGFTHATAVYFGSIAAATFSVTSDTSINATTAPASASAPAPASTARTSDTPKRLASAMPAAGVTVSVLTDGGKSPATPAGTFVFMPAVVPMPTVARLSPASGTSAGGTSVTISGSALSGATAVRFGAAAAVFTVSNSTSLVAIAPAGSGTVNVTVTTPGGTSAGGSAAFTYKAAATTVVVASSSNPAAARTPVTFTATVASAGSTPTGSVRFKDGATVIGTVALAGGVAELTTSALSIGTHAIAVEYGGNPRFAPNTSATLAQAIDVPADSNKLRALQLAASKLVAQASGQAISSAIESAIADGFSGRTPLITPSATGVKLNIAEAGSRHKGATQLPMSVPVAPWTKSHIFDAATPPDTGNATKPTLPREWLVWADVQRTGITHTGSAAATTIYGDQINALAGVTRKVSPNLLVGVLGGYETFDYRSDALVGRLNGNGTTLGAYLGWKFVRGLRFDVAGAHTAVAYDGVASTAAGAFTGSRWLVSSGLIGTYDAAAFSVEPSAKVYALRESQSAYTDSLGTPQSTSTFTTGRTSAGAKIATLPKTTNFIAPYAGFYADYYFNGENAALEATATAVPLAAEKILAGWSARALAGFAARLGDATTVTCEVEYGGIGSNSEILKYRCNAGLPFLRSRRTDK